MKENDKPEKHEYEIKFEFKNGKSYTLSYSYDSESQAIKYGDGLVSSELKEKLGKQVLDLESVLIREMIRENSDNVTDDSVSLYKEQIKNNLVKIDLGKDFLIDIIPDIFGLQNLCKNNLEVEVPYVPYLGRKNEITKEKTEQIINQVDKIYGKSGEKKITFLERSSSGLHDNDVNSWIQGYVCGYGGDGRGEQAEKYTTKYANWELKEIEQKEEEADISQKTKENQNLNDNQITPTQGHDSQKSENNEKISLGGKIARIIFLIILIAFAIFLPTYLWIVGLLFSNIAIPIVVFSAEAILITLIIIFILSIRNIDNENNLLQKQIGLGKGEFSTSEQEKLMDKGKNEKEPKNNPEPNQLIKNNGQNLGEHIQNDK